jgi:hypothetical protein
MEAKQREAWEEKILQWQREVNGASVDIAGIAVEVADVSQALASTVGSLRRILSAVDWCYVASGMERGDADQVQREIEDSLASLETIEKNLRGLSGSET